MDIERKHAMQDAWRRWRWLLFAVIAGGFVFFVVWTRSDWTQSRWSYERDGAYMTFTEKIVPKTRLAEFEALFPKAAFDWFGKLGLGIDAGNAFRTGDDLVVFAAWGDYAAAGIDDRLIFHTLKKGHATELRRVTFMAQDYKLNEAVAPAFATSDGQLLFLDLREKDLEAAVIHGMAHVLARKNTPRALADEMDPSKAQAYDARKVKDFRFVDEVVALFLSDLRMSGATAADATGLEALAVYDAKRYAPDGPIFMDESLTFTFGSDPRTPETFAGAARFALALAKDKGLDATLAFAGRFVRGDYRDLDDLLSGLGGDLPTLLKRYMGREDIPE